MWFLELDEILIAIQRVFAAKSVVDDAHAVSNAELLESQLAYQKLVVQALSYLMFQEMEQFSSSLTTTKLPEKDIAAMVNSAVADLGNYNPTHDPNDIAWKYVMSLGNSYLKTYFPRWGEISEKATSTYSKFTTVSSKLDALVKNKSMLSTVVGRMPVETASFLSKVSPIMPLSPTLVKIALEYEKMQGLTQGKRVSEFIPAMLHNKQKFSSYPFLEGEKPLIPRVSLLPAVRGVVSRKPRPKRIISTPAPKFEGMGGGSFGGGGAQGKW